MRAAARRLVEEDAEYKGIHENRRRYAPGLFDSAQRDALQNLNDPACILRQISTEDSSLRQLTAALLVDEIVDGDIDKVVNFVNYLPASIFTLPLVLVGVTYMAVFHY